MYGLEAKPKSRVSCFLGWPYELWADCWSIADRLAQTCKLLHMVGWLVCFFTLLFGCFSLLSLRKVAGLKEEGSSNESSMFCNDCTPVWGKSYTILIVRIINKEIPKGAPRSEANRCLG